MYTGVSTGIDPAVGDPEAAPGLRKSNKPLASYTAGGIVLAAVSAVPPHCMRWLSCSLHTVMFIIADTLVLCQCFKRFLMCVVSAGAGAGECGRGWKVGGKLTTSVQLPSTSLGASASTSAVGYKFRVHHLGPCPTL